MGLATLISDLSWQQLSDLTHNPTAYPQERLTVLALQAATAATAFVVFPVIFYYLFIEYKEQQVAQNNRDKEENQGGYSAFLALKKIPRLWLLIFPFLITWFSFPISSFLGVLNESLVLPDFLSEIEKWMRLKEDTLKELTIFMTTIESPRYFFFAFITIAVLPGVGEEILFRGILQPLFERIYKNSHVAIWVTAFVFSAVHIQFYGFLPRLFLGAVFGYLYLYGRNLSYPILGHLVNNGTTLIIAYLIGTEKALDTTFGVETPEVMTLFPVFLVAIATVLLLLRLFGQKNKIFFDLQKQ
jgi:membrane protease YdiL (CAAX protease family)